MLNFVRLMPRIDSETVQKILDAADIVEVVSDFVHLRRRGANYVGLCPFHNERTPSFSVSKSKGICKCFSCGKGGSAVNFIMLHEQMTFNEALRYLARKYNIEIVEHEMTQQEREQQTERESMLAVNEFAMQHFQHNLTETDEGRNVGLAYFRQRGISDEMISRFHLGYAIDKGNELLKKALSMGFSEKHLLETGLVGKTERGDYYDRFRGRVIYPVASLSGKIVAFGGRVLRSDRPGGKYVNSPESIIYRKSYELYGFYQAKAAIVKRNKCILVEGYMDVISMHQSGVENVVASSGTSLTDGQIRLIHRFTENITVIYDADPAGIKASLRGIDMILAEGMNVKVLLLPAGEDPDSFSQSHSSSEVEQYLSEHETDFIKFKIDILTQGVGDDPILRAKAVSDIVRSIAVIPDEISRVSYVKECSFAMNFDEAVLANEVRKSRAQYLEQEFKRKKSEEARKIESKDTQEELSTAADEPQPVAVDADIVTRLSKKNRSSHLREYEMAIMRYAVKYAFGEFDAKDADGNDVRYVVVDYLRRVLEQEELEFSNTMCRRLFDAILELHDSFESDRERFIRSALEKREQMWTKGEENIRNTAGTLEEIERLEAELTTRCDEVYAADVENFCFNYAERRLTSSPDDDIRNLSTELVAERHHLSKIHTKYAHVPQEREQLAELLPRAVFELENAILELDIKEVNGQMREECKKNNPDQEMIGNLMVQIARMQELKKQFARYLGDRVVTPMKK